MTDIASDDEIVEESTPDGVTDTPLEFQFPTLTKQRVAVVGFAGGHAHKAPFADTDVEMWGINQLWKILPDRRWDRWFELHDLYEFYHANEPHQKFLREFDGPVYVRAQDYQLALKWGIDTAQPFPHNVILEKFEPYFTNTVSWLIALAIMMGPEWLGVYGVDMAQDHLLAAEYSEQRPSCEYFLGIARGVGIDVHIPPGSDLLGATHLYGYENPAPVIGKMESRFAELGANKEQLRAQRAQAQAQIDQIDQTMAQMDGAMQEVTFWRKNWTTLPATE